MAKIRLQVLLCVIMTAASLSWAVSPFTAHFRASDCQFTQVGAFTRIAPRNYPQHQHPGWPELPVVYVRYIIPLSMKPDSLHIVSYGTSTLSGTYYVYPMQPIVPMDSTAPWVPPDSSVYNSAAQFPSTFAEIAGVGEFDNAKIVTVALYPLLCTPQTQTLALLDSITFVIAQSPDNTPAVSRTRTASCQAFYDATLQGMVANPGDVPAYYNRPTVVADGDTAALLMPHPLPPAAPYTIITNQVAAFSPLRDWLTQRGVWSVIVTPQMIYQAVGGYDNPERIRNYLKLAWQHSGLTWVLLAGDDGYVPVRYGHYYDNYPNPWSEYTIPADLYYSDLEGNWDYNQNFLWGEPTNDRAGIFPDVTVGRIPCRTAEEAGNWVYKELYYQRNGSADLTLLPKDLWIYLPDWTPHEYGVPEQFPRAPGGPYPNPPLEDIDQDADVALAHMNLGYGFTGQYGHGGPYEFETRHVWAQVHAYYGLPPNSACAGMERMTNVNRYGTVLSMGCYCAAFDSFVSHTGHDPTDTAIVDAFLLTYRDYPERWTPVGANTFVGQTRYGYHATIDLHSHMMGLLFSGNSPIEWVPSQGQALALAKVFDQCDRLHDWYDGLATNFFGSPETDLWVTEPKTMAASHPSEIPQGVPVSFRVVVTSGGSPVDQVRVCLDKPGDIYQVGKTGPDGSVTFQFTPQTPGTILVTCGYHRMLTTAYTQFLPTQTECVVISAGGASPNGQDNSEFPLVLSLYVSTTNPVRGPLAIRCGVPKACKASLRILDAAGRGAAGPSNLSLAPGWHQFTWDHLGGLAAGDYWLVLRTQGASCVKRLVIAK